MYSASIPPFLGVAMRVSVWDAIFIEPIIFIALIRSMTVWMNKCHEIISGHPKIIMNTKG